MIERKTIFSEDRKYRYTLWRQWSDDLFKNRTKEGFIQFIGLNPSTADEILDDPTIRRCMRFAKDWGYMAMCMTNVYAFRASKPEDLKAKQWPCGNDANFVHIFDVAKEAALIIAAWGTHASFIKVMPELIIETVQSAGKQLHHLGLNSDGSPKHPLYLKASTKPQLWK
jgi:hypothetical protein